MPETAHRTIQDIQNDRARAMVDHQEYLRLLAMEQRQAIIANGGYAANAQEFKEAILSEAILFGQDKADRAEELIDTLTNRHRHNYNGIVAFDVANGLPRKYAKLMVSPESSKNEPTPLRYKIGKNMGHLTLVLARTITFDYPINEEYELKEPVISDKPDEIAVAYFRYDELSEFYSQEIPVINGLNATLTQYQSHLGDAPHRDDAFFDQHRFARNNLFSN